MNAGNDFSGKTIKLTDKIDLSAHYWTPIGLYKKFSGTFDGQNNQITGMFISEWISMYTGLFGCLDRSGSICNIMISGKIDIT